MSLTSPTVPHSPRERRYWINTVTLDHVLAATVGGFTQAEHGAGQRLRQPRRGDEMLFYSPRASLTTRVPVQQFTAWATIEADEPYQAQLSDDFHPWRLPAHFHPVTPVDVRPLLEILSFVPDSKHWGLPFRRGMFAISQHDFNTIVAAVQPRGEGSPAKAVAN